MNDWIEEEGRELDAKLANQRREQEVLRRSNLWADLIEQLRSDVARINASERWKAHLPEPVVFKRENGSIMIAKETLPALVIYVTNQGHTVEVKTTIYKKMGQPRNGERELLAVGVDNDRVYLANNDVMYVIPEDASRHILSRLLEFIKENAT